MIDTELHKDILTEIAQQFGLDICSAAEMVEQKFSDHFTPHKELSHDRIVLRWLCSELQISYSDKLFALYSSWRKNTDIYTVLMLRNQSFLEKISEMINKDIVSTLSFLSHEMNRFLLSQVDYSLYPVPLLNIFSDLGLDEEWKDNVISFYKDWRYLYF